jgi:hypothetical protein
MAKKKVDRQAVIADMIANPEKWRKKSEAAARREHPEMTREQMDASWDQVKHQLGL